MLLLSANLNAYMLVSSHARQNRLCGVFLMLGIFKTKLQSAKARRLHAWPAIATPLIAEQRLSLLLRVSWDIFGSAVGWWRFIPYRGSWIEKACISPWKFPLIWREDVSFMAVWNVCVLGSSCHERHTYLGPLPSQNPFFLFAWEEDLEGTLWSLSHMHSFHPAWLLSCPPHLPQCWGRGLTWILISGSPCPLRNFLGSSVRVWIHSCIPFHQASPSQCIQDLLYYLVESLD